MVDVRGIKQHQQTLRTTDEQRFADVLFEAGMCTVEHDGRITLHLDRLRSHAQAMNMAVALLWEVIKNIPRDCIADCTDIATPIVACLSNQTHIPMISPLYSASMILGAYTRGQRCIAIADAPVLGDNPATRAVPLMMPLETLVHHGLAVTDIVWLLDTGEGDPWWLTKYQIRTHRALRMEGLLAYALRTERITQSKYDEAQRVLAGST